MRIATIDIGTNTTLLLVAEQRPDGTAAPRLERAEITRLGRGIGGDGLLRDENIRRTLEVLASYADDARRLDATVFAIGTEGLRRAPNASTFLEPAARILGTEVQVISGDREAALTFLAALRAFPQDTGREAAVIDIGGGSTEIILSRQGEITFRESLPLGSVRLTETFVTHDPPTEEEATRLGAHVAAELSRVPFTPGSTLIGTAGTVTTLAAMAQSLTDYDPARVHGYRLSAAELHAQIERLAAATQAEREGMPGLDPRRADVIFAGALLLKGLMDKAQAPFVLVSDRGIRWGLLHEQLEKRVTR